jgi:PAS domain S-box-containing protein
LPPTKYEFFDKDATAHLAGLLDSAMDAIITVDDAQRVVLYNQAAEKIFGWTAADMLGQALTRLIPASSRKTHAEHMKRFGETGATSRRMGGLNVVYGRHADGHDFPMDASISQLDTSQGKLFTVVLRDVSERLRAQEELAAYAAQANAIREQEKTRVARELHDELAQSLTVLKMDTIWLRDHMSAQPEAAQGRLASMLAMLDQSVAATRRIAADLRPLVLDDLGLAASIEWLAQSFSQRTGVPCVLDLAEDLELHEPYATAVFRMVQESLANVAKHAAASSVQVQVVCEPTCVSLRVADNGSGFQETNARKPTSLGLVGLRERAHLLKGTVQIKTSLGCGTVVQARIPVLPAKEEA